MKFDEAIRNVSEAKVSKRGIQFNNLGGGIVKPYVQENWYIKGTSKGGPEGKILAELILGLYSSSDRGEYSHEFPLGIPICSKESQIITDNLSDEVSKTLKPILTKLDKDVLTAMSKLGWTKNKNQ